MPLAPPPPLYRDRWAWLSVLAVLPILIHTWGAPLGEPFADDFHFMHRALLSGQGSFFDGYGSPLYWRPLARQIYFGLLSGTILAHPWLVPALHAGLLSLTSVLLYRAFRVSQPGPIAAAIATFPLLMESSRMLLAWPSHFQDVGALVFAALALHEAAHDRLGTALAAMGASLLCKEVGVATALLLPWMPGMVSGAPDSAAARRRRVRWLLGVCALLAIWAAVYLIAYRTGGMSLPRAYDSATAATPLPMRYAWACWQSLRAAFSLMPLPGRWDWVVAIGLGAIVLAWLARMIARHRLTSHLRTAAPAVLWGAAWFLAASATLSEVYPMWAPYRAIYGSIGLGVVLIGLIGAGNGALVMGLVLLRLVAFSLSPGPPTEISDRAPQNGADFDFERLVRVERLMHETRVMLKSEFPTLPRGSMVGQHYLPRLSAYAFCGDKALQVWYRDTTMRWVRYADFVPHPQQPLAVIAEFQPHSRPQMAPVNTEAMRSFLAAVDSMNQQKYAAGLAGLARAESLQRDSTARVFRAEIWGERANCLMYLHRPAEAADWAIRGVALWPENVSALFALGCLACERGDLELGVAKLDSVLRFSPGYGGASEIRQRALDAIAERERGRRPARP